MVGLVIVSHSAKLAEGVVELMRGMAGEQVQIAAAGGMDTPEHGLGTDANLIHNAIERVYSPDGVVVLVDLGSAILSTEFALDMLTPEQRTHVRIAPAPLVEGGIAAAVQAKLGSPPDAVIAEARSAFDAKLAQMGVALAQAGGTAELEPFEALNQPTSELVLTVKNRLGLHARPAAKFVQAAARFAANVLVQDVTNGRGPVNAKSINAVATLGVLQGHEIKITAQGADAQRALDALNVLAEENFGDTETEAAEERQPMPVAEAMAENEYAGRAASPGYAMGPARIYVPTLPPIPQDSSQDPEEQWKRLARAIQAAEEQLERVRDALHSKSRKGEAEIFEAQILMLQDEAIQEPARRAIFEEKRNAAWAFDEAATGVALGYEKLESEYLRARAADVRAVARLVLQNLLGVSGKVEFEKGVLIAPDLTPAETAHLDPKLVQAICTAFGGPTGHSAILAKSLGIPAVVGLGERILRVKDGETLLVDGYAGRVWVKPDAELIQDYTTRMERAERSADEIRALRLEPAVTRDGHRVEIAANIGSVKDAKLAVEMGAEAVGLFRTEFLFLDRRDAPSEEEQFETYRAVAQVMEGRPLLIRTLDIGGDKPLAYANAPQEANPFLGLRGLRFGLAHPDLFTTQLRAILRVANDFPVRMMFPMVSTVKEFRAAQDLVEQARVELNARGITPPRVETGIMVEVPSAALHAKAFAREVDFFSIGTNDLTQYTLAAERGNPNVAELAEELHPAVLQLVGMVVDAAHAEGKWVGVCGEMGGDPKAIPLLVGLGVDELSMAPPLIPRGKQIVRELSFAEEQVKARQVVE